MKGVVFTEFMEMVEARFSADMVDDIIDDAQIKSGGAYTAVGSYPFAEMVALVTALSQRSGLEPQVLIYTFGHYLFGRFAQLYPYSIQGCNNAFMVLSNIEKHIHQEVHKLYPDAQLPHIEVLSSDERCLTLLYRSPRCLASLATGLIQGALDHFSEQGRITAEPLNADGSEVRFVVELL
ncbi:heme NO-binding domain-containing protein [Aquitalea sp. ASV11]|uniref:heme NO-binding domain-containing protein n=1 Tax=Aquitalea sp. ASV11 TaxID=2795103 RepID=UPI0018EB548E|nr:heme NO-binding domain-containing protein [Aquitalea sp. ASV11]